MSDLKRIKLEVRPVAVIADGAMAAASVADGRLAPVLLVDATQRQDLVELIRLHRGVSVGDVITWWGMPDKKGKPVILHLEFSNPLVTSADIVLPLPHRATLVDVMISARCLYLQAAQPGDKLSTTMEAPRILIEVHPGEIESHWEDVYHSVTAKFMRDKGMSRSESKTAASSHIRSWREIAGIRIPDPR